MAVPWQTSVRDPGVVFPAPSPGPLWLSALLPLSAQVAIKDKQEGIE